MPDRSVLVVRSLREGGLVHQTCSVILTEEYLDTKITCHGFDMWKSYSANLHSSLLKYSYLLMRRYHANPFWVSRNLITR